MSITVTLLPHPKGDLMRIEHDGGWITLDREEALELHDQLHAKLGEMAVTLSGSAPAATAPVSRSGN